MISCLMLDVESSRLRVRIDPTLGGRLTSVFDSIEGREWLVQPSQRPDRQQYGASFTSREIYGWDEMLPTIDGCVVDGRTLPDHGEIWAIPWLAIPSHRPDGIRLSAAARRWPVRIEREVWPRGSAIEIDYRLDNESDHQVPVVWAAHPQFAVSGAAHLEVEGAAGRVVVVSPGSQASRSTLRASISRAAGQPLGSHLKVWLEPAERATSVLLRDGPCGMRISWDGEPLKYLGVLWDNAAFSHQTVIAVEPSTGWHDSLALAVQTGEVLVLPPRGAASWMLRLEAVSVPGHDAVVGGGAAR